ncbi:MAG: PspC domain-containing protein [Chloroflexaceae bacterium]
MNSSTQKLMRSRSDKMISGVAGGIGHYLAIDPVIVRLGFVALVFSGIGLLLYPLLWIIMPVEPDVPAYVAQPGTPSYGQASAAGSDPADQEIPIHNVNPTENSSAEDVRTRRNRTLGTILVGVGAFILVGKALPWLIPFIFPAVLVGAGILLLRRGA